MATGGKTRGGRAIAQALLRGAFRSFRITVCG
jgi:hypothetical protein